MLNSVYTWLVTGGAGFIGSHIVRELLRQGQNVRVLDNLSTGRLENLAGLEDKIQLVNADICDYKAILPAFRGTDYVLHHAALVSVPQSIKEPLNTYRMNVYGTASVLEAAKNSGVKRVVFACSCAIYGNGRELPYRETSATDCQSPYALSKQMGRELCREYTRLYGLDTVSLIYFNVFGPNQNADSPYSAVIAKFMQSAVQNKPLCIDWDGRQSRDFIHVRDIVRANILAAIKGTPGESYNVASGETHSLLELVDMLDGITGRKLPRVFRPKRAGDIKISAANTEKIRALGFKPEVSLEDGLREMFALLTQKKITG
ncbi:MAG: GDP-mannose 4,6-dehydratase [Elusimicrobiales bacterium]|nr:GDP-mannose 4,6-dehydratase [Elusimicrobiales bacterium]